MVMAVDINFLNQLSELLYTARDQRQRQHAEEQLAKLADSDECLPNCLALLEQGQPPYAIMMGCATLKRLLVSKISLTTIERLELSRYLLKYLLERGPALPKYLQGQICKNFALVTKISWLEGDEDTNDYPFQQPMAALVARARNPSSVEGLLSLRLVTALVEEMSCDKGLDSISRLRKISAELRDSYLLAFFQLAVEILAANCPAALPAATTDGLTSFGAATGRPGAMGSASGEYLLQAVDLALACMSYDFIGSMSDEILDDNINIQVPSKWRSVFIDHQVVALFFQLYKSSPPLPEEAVSKVFQVLVQLASVRRMLFDTTDRQRYLDQLISGMKSVLESPQRLEEQANFHEFCRITSRLKANYQIAELMKCKDFLPLLTLLTDFTAQSLLAITMFNQNSIYYLMSFWSRIVGSMTYSRMDVEQIGECVPKIAEAFIESRMKLGEAVVRHGLEDPLESMGTVKQMMDLFTVVSRRDYHATVHSLCTHFNESMSVLTSIDPDAQVSPIDSRVAAKRLIWIVTMMGAGLNGHSYSNDSDSDDAADGEISAKVFRLMYITDQMAESERRNWSQLEMAYLYMMEEFRKAYMADQPNSRDSKCFIAMGRELGMDMDEGKAIKLYAQKIINNLKFWGAKNERVLHSTLHLLSELTVGYHNVRKLLKLDEIKKLLVEHDKFEFIEQHNPQQLSGSDWRGVMKSRTAYYSCLAKLLYVELEESDEPFYRFMEPITGKFYSLSQYIIRSPSNGRPQLAAVVSDRQEEVKWAVAGLCRDLRGIASACVKKSHFQRLLLEEWFGLSETGQSAIFTCLQLAAVLWAHDTDVMSPLLKLVAELVQNRQSRLVHDMSSCSSVLLFHSVADILTAYGARVMELPDVIEERIYKDRLKGLMLMAQSMKHILQGNYLPYGVFRYYRDESLNQLLTGAFQLFVRCNQQVDLLEYGKVAKELYYWLDHVTRELTPTFVAVKLPVQVLSELLKFIKRGICCSLDSSIISSACTSLEQLLDYLMELDDQVKSNRNGSRKQIPWATGNSPTRHSPENSTLLQAFNQHLPLFQELTTTMLQQYLNDEVKCQWSVSRPLLALCIICRPAFDEWRAKLVQKQPSLERRREMEKAFEKLVEGMGPKSPGSDGSDACDGGSTTMKNKDTFTQQLGSFRRDVETVAKGEAVISGCGGWGAEDSGVDGTDGIADMSYSQQQNFSQSHNYSQYMADD